MKLALFILTCCVSIALIGEEYSTRQRDLASENHSDHDDHPDHPVAGFDCNEESCTQIPYLDVFNTLLHDPKLKPKLIELIKLHVETKPKPWERNKAWFDALMPGGFNPDRLKYPQKFAVGILYEIAQRVKHETGHSANVTVDWASNKLLIQVPRNLPANVRADMTKVIRSFLIEGKMDSLCSGAAVKALENAY